MFSKEEIRNKYDKLARWYDFFEFIGEYLFARKLRKKLMAKASGKVLELAVGTGKNIPYYPENLEITAIDLSEEMIKKAQKRAKRHGRTIKFQLMDSENLKFTDNTFDTVVDSGALCTYPNPMKALKEMARVCKPKGNIILLEHGKSSKKWLAKWQDKKAENHAKRLCCYWNRDPANLVNKAGLKIIKSERTFFGILYSIVAEPNTKQKN